MKYWIIILSFLLSQPGFCDDPHLEQKGYVLIQDSWIFSPDKAKDVRDRLIDLDTNNHMIDSLNKSIDLYKANDAIQKDEITTLLDQNDKLAKSERSTRILSDVEKVGIFALGIATTVFAGWAVKKVSQ